MLNPSKPQLKPQPQDVGHDIDFSIVFATATRWPGCFINQLLCKSAISPSLSHADENITPGPYADHAHTSGPTGSCQTHCWQPSPAHNSQRPIQPTRALATLGIYRPVIGDFIFCAKEPVMSPYVSLSPPHINGLLDALAQIAGPALTTST